MLGQGSKYAAELLEQGLLTDSIKSPKISVLKEYVDNFLSEYPGNKVVIFTSYVKMVDIIRETLSSLGCTSQPYTGEMNAKEKEAAKVAFQTDANCRILVSSDAGGYGVDLPQANLLINYDLPWNAGLALQRNGRIRRASSEWSHIVIQDILMQGSIEERQHSMLAQKMAVANAVIDGEGINDKGGVTMSVGTLRSFLQEAII
jgi:superfamily II DNA/RNA helicase